MNATGPADNHTIEGAALAGLIDNLLEGWLRFVGDDGPVLAEWRERTEAQVVTIMTLTAHVHATATILRPVLPDGLTIAHMPLVRSIFESTMTIVWCDEVADGAHALINEGARQRRSLRDALAATHSMTELAAQVQTSTGRFTTSSEQQARYFEKRCEDIALDGAYALYRMLSSFSHTSIDTIDAYLDGDTFTPGQALSVKSNPGVLGSGSSWAHMIACCLLWSGMVTNYLDRGRTRRNDLRRIARRLQVNPELAVRYSAHTRGRHRP